MARKDDKLPKKTIPVKTTVSEEFVVVGISAHIPVEVPGHVAKEFRYRPAAVWSAMAKGYALAYDSLGRDIPQWLGMLRFVLDRVADGRKRIDTDPAPTDGLRLNLTEDAPTSLQEKAQQWLNSSIPLEDDFDDE